MNKIKFESLTEAIKYKPKKCENGYVNIQRENIISSGLNDYIKNKDDKNYKCDPKIKEIYDLFKQDGFEIEKCEKKGGMSESYDFLLTMKSGDKKTCEFKGMKKMVQLSDQFLKNTNIIENCFELFTNIWIEKLKESKKNFNMKTEIPTIEELRENICKTGKSSCEFLEELKKNCLNKKNADIQNELSKETISQFIKDNETKVDKKLINKIYTEKYKCKDFNLHYDQKLDIFMLKTNKKIMDLEIKDISLKYNKNKKYVIGFDIKFDITENNIKQQKSSIIRFIWKNRNGVYCPAWKLCPIK